MESGLEEVRSLRELVLAAQRDGERLLAEALRPLGLTPAQAEVLGVLAGRPSWSLRAVGERLVCETGSPSRLVGGLVVAGLVARHTDPADRRGIVLSLTPAGKTLAGKAGEVERELLEELAQLLANLPVEAANRVLWRLVEHLPGGRALRRRRDGPR